MKPTETRAVARVGPVTVEIRSADKVSDLVAEELEGQSSDVPAPADLKITIADRAELLPEYHPEIYAAKEMMNFDGRSLWVGYHKYFRYLLVNPFALDEPIELYLIRKHPHPLARLFISPERLKSAVMTYQIFWHVFYLALIKQRATFLHAGIFSDENGATAITGTGGSGKTSCLFHMLGQRERLKYLSEDFGIIDAEANVFYNPKFVSIYHTDTRQELLRRHVDKALPFKKRVGWSFNIHFLRSNPRIKVSPRQLLGDARIEARTVLKKVCYLVRGNFETLSVKEVDADELAERSLNVTFREMKRLTEVLRLVNANQVSNTAHLSLDELMEINRALYKSVFDKVSTRMIRVPKDTPPDALEEAILG